MRKRLKGIPVLVRKRTMKAAQGHVSACKQARDRNLKIDVSNDLQLANCGFSRIDAMKKQAHSTGNRVMKSSKEARDLIRAVQRSGKKRKRSYRDVARLLRLPNYGQVQKILNGEIRDTLAMKAALRRADGRAGRAYYNVKALPPEVVDEAALRVAVDQLERTLNYLKSLLPKS